MEGKIIKEFFFGLNLYVIFFEKIKLVCYVGNLV